MVYGAFVLGVAAFVVSSIQQVAGQVFLSPKDEGEAQIHPKVATDCESALRLEIEAIEKARIAASRELNPENARATYAALRPPASPPIEVKTACAKDPNGLAATAALVRLDRAAETHAFSESNDLRAVRLAAQSFIRSSVP